MRSAVTRLVHVIVEEGVANADDAAIRSGLWSQASQLTDLLLDAFKTHADFVEKVRSHWDRSARKWQLSVPPCWNFSFH